jgi:hypothetical protein
MSLAQKNAKKYLQVEDADGGFVIVAGRADAEALAALFVQHGIVCWRETHVQAGQDVLRFLGAEDRAQVERVLDGYRTATGS